MKQEPLKIVAKAEDFPELSTAQNNPDGLLACSEQLSTELLISAYNSGIFPWFTEQQPVLWWSPSKRAILKPVEIKLKRSLKKTIRKNNYTVSLNSDFSAVIRNCASIKRVDQHDTWINQQMISFYIELHNLGYAHSIECWQQGSLVGGLYGIYVQGVFCGESMFSLTTDSSKTCLLGLAQNASALGIHLIDCQIMNPYLKSMGAIEISRNNFIKQFKKQSIKLKQPTNSQLPIRL